ncbi:MULTISPECIES: hypothetical protein [Streptomyces]|jgi:hypothetical protein|uniref:hypothetical protein n=1 Tax=Streptomyces TaxID=1883 RepID=UPI0011525691|nr:hypothetical protein [Streptomyces sp. SLBN-134]TQL18325.1 hypothetical protein FBY37_0222 [Streptomyces sp. SLBN-134]
MAVDYWHACVAHERRIQVVVAAAARAWHQDDGRVPLPRFTDWGATYVRPSRERPGGEVAFSVPLRDAR